MRLKRLLILKLFDAIKKRRLEQQGEKKMEFFGLKHGQTNQLSSLRVTGV